MAAAAATTYTKRQAAELLKSETHVVQWSFVYEHRMYAQKRPSDKRREDAAARGIIVGRGKTSRSQRVGDDEKLVVLV